ncbi:hypothetical protein AB1Y20_013179 [Prymnesium parvum]|uniref:FHA domain-containing protein n=1 Tax=Prymnesium parvum TaxID=97485 RepID=A0AB34IKQ8_PRYPA
MTCPYGRMVVIKLNGTDGGNCVMEEDQLLIGRDPEQCDIVIRLPEVSKMQAKLSADDENQVWLENLSQTNPGGTMVNESRVEKPTLLDDQDIISICGRRFRFEYGNSDMLDATIAISSYVPAPGSAKKVTSVKKVASVKKATKDEKPKENKETENKAITPSKPTLQAEQRKLSNGARTPLDEVREALKARREALAGKSTTPSPAPTPSKSPAGLIKQAKSPRNNPCEAAKTSSTGFRPVISADELKNALAARRSSAMGPPPARVAGTPKGTFDCGELEKALRKRMSSEVLQSPVQPNLAQPLTGGKPTNTKSVTKPPSARHTDEDISDRGDAEPIAAFVLEAAAQAPAVTRSVLPSPLKRQIMARRPPSTGGNSTSGSAHSHRNSVGPSPLKVLTMARLPTPLREAIQGRRQSVESAVAFAPEASNPSINGTPTRVEPTPEKQPSSTVKGALRVTFGDVPNSARKSVRVSFGPQASPGVAPERRGRYAMPTPEGCPAEDIVKEPVRLSTDQTPGRRFGTREQTPTTAGAANSASTSVMLKEAVNAKFTPEAASIVHHLMEGEFSPMQPVQTSSSNVMSIVGVFSLRKASAASEATTNVVASPCPPGGRVNKHERFGSPGSIARRLESRSAWIAKLDMKLDAKDQVIANPDRLTLLHQCTDNVGEYTSSDWAEWELKEYEAWEENEWAHSALQDTDWITCCFNGTHFFKRHSILGN